MTKGIVNLNSLGIAFKEENGDLKFVDKDIFDRRKLRIGFLDSPYKNLLNHEKEFKQIQTKIKKMPERFNGKIVFVVQTVEFDTKKLYNGKGCNIDKVEGNKVNISSLDKTKRGYQYYNNDDCIKSIKIFEYKKAKSLTVVQIDEDLHLKTENKKEVY